MKKFEYTIKDEMGIHARPAGMLAKEGKKYESKITITKEGRTVEAEAVPSGMACRETYPAGGSAVYELPRSLL